MQGVYLSEAVIGDWVAGATSNVYERADVAEVISALQRACGGRVTLHDIELRFREVMDDETVHFTKYTARYLLEHLPEELLV